MRSIFTQLHEVSAVARKFMFSEIFFGFGIGIWNIALNFHMRMNGIDDKSISLLLGAAFTATAIAAFFCGRVGDATGFNRVMGSGGLLVSLALFINAFATSVPAFFVGQIVYGVGLSCIVSMEYPQLLSYVDGAHSAFSYNFAILLYFFSSVMGNLFAGMFADGYVLRFGGNPYKLLLLISAVMYAFLGVARIRLPRQTVVTSRRVRLSTVLRQKNVMTYLLFGFVTMIIFNGVMSMLNLVLRQWHGLSDTQIGVIFAAASILGGFVVMFLPLLQAKMRNDHIAQGIMLTQALCIMLISVAGPVLTGVFICVRNMATNSIYSTVDRPMLQSIAKDRQGSYSGLRSSANYVGMSLGVLISGWFVSAQQYSALFIVVALLGIVQCAIYRWLCSPHLKGNAEREATQ